jgi:hypothetical protein
MPVGEAVMLKAVAVVEAACPRPVCGDEVGFELLAEFEFAAKKG